MAAIENEALFDMIAKLHDKLDMYDKENRELRSENAMLLDEIKLLRRNAQIGEATENFFKQIKQIMR